jgi:hypothetical protein
MAKHEVKVELSNKDLILETIQKTYPKKKQGKINGKDNFFEVGKDEENFSVFKGLGGSTVKISNQSIIDGTLRVMVEEKGENIKLYPISIYCVKDEEQGRFIFY